MMTRKNYLMLSLIVSSIALTACTIQQVDSNIEDNEIFFSANELHNRFSSTMLTHRKPGEIAVNSFEAKLRNKVRTELNIDFEYLANASKEELLTDLNQADTRLSHFKHATHRGSAQEQLWALLPALPTLEQRKALQVALEERFNESPELANTKMAELMDLQLNKLFGDFTISLDALTPETEKFETSLIKELKSEGLNISARRPSLILEYFIDTYSDQDEVELIADFELKNRSNQTFHTLSSVTTYSSAGGLQAQKDAFSFLANDIAEQLIEKATARINNVNRVK